MADSSAGTIYYDIDVRTEKAVDAVRTVSDVNGRVEKSFGVVDTATKRTTSNLGALGKRAGMAGIQIQQFVGQVTTGTNTMTAMSMQAADLGFVLGFPLLGAVAGITASLAGPFITAITGADSATKEFNDTINDTIAGLKSTRIESVSGAIDALSEKIRKSAEEMARLEKPQIGRSAKMLSTSREEKRLELLKQQSKDTEALAVLEKRLADIRNEGGSLQTPIPESDGFELADWFAEQDAARQADLDNRARYSMAVIAQMQSQAATEEEAANTKLEAELAAIEEARAQKLELGASYDELEAQSKQLHADKLAEIDAKRTATEEAEAAKRLQAKQLELNAYSQLGGQLTGLMSALGMEQTALGKAVFLANQAIAVAGIIVSTRQAAAQAKAFAPDPISGEAAAARVTALGYASAAIAAGVAVGTAAGRQTGGPTEADTPYRINEAGPEMFSMGGRDYLLGGEKGKVTPLSSGSGAGTSVNITMINQGTQSEVVSDDGQGNLIIKTVVANMNQRGEIFKAITQNTNATGRTK